MTPAEVLRAGARVIDERGLAVGEYADERGRVCALGAIKLAAGGSHLLALDGAALDAAAAVASLLRRPRSPLTGDDRRRCIAEIARWSDRSTAPAAAAVLRETAAMLDSGALGAGL